MGKLLASAGFHKKSMRAFILSALLSLVCLGAAAVGSGLLSDNAIVLAVGPAVVGLWLGAASLRRR